MLHIAILKSKQDKLHDVHNFTCYDCLSESRDIHAYQLDISQVSERVGGVSDDNEEGQAQGYSLGEMIESLRLYNSVVSLGSCNIRSIDAFVLIYNSGDDVSIGNICDFLDNTDHTDTDYIGKMLCLVDLNKGEVSKLHGKVYSRLVDRGLVVSGMSERIRDMAGSWQEIGIGAKDTLSSEVSEVRFLVYSFMQQVRTFLRPSEKTDRLGVL